MSTVYGPDRARVVNLHDGDTIRLDIDLGFGFQLRAYNIDDDLQWSCRVYGINSPELEVGGQPNQPGLDALAYAQTLLKPGDVVHVTSFHWDEYGGRYDGKITLADGQDFGTLMIQSGHAVVKKG